MVPAQSLIPDAAAIRQMRHTSARPPTRCTLMFQILGPSSATTCRASAAGRPVFGDPEGHAARNAARRLDLEARGEELWEPDAATVRVEIPGGGLDPGAREGIAADGVAQGGVHGLGGVELPPQDPRDQDALNQVAGARQRLLGVERQLERRRLAVANVAFAVVQHDDDGVARADAAARDDERLDEGERELVQLSPSDAHPQRDRGNAAPRPAARAGPAPRARAAPPPARPGGETRARARPAARASRAWRGTRRAGAEGTYGAGCSRSRAARSP